MTSGQQEWTPQVICIHEHLDRYISMVVAESLVAGMGLHRTPAPVYWTCLIYPDIAET